LPVFGSASCLKTIRTVKPGQFDIQGIAPIAYPVFAVVLGIAVGSMIRRVLPARAMTLAAFTAVRIVGGRAHTLRAPTQEALISESESTRIKVAQVGTVVEGDRKDHEGAQDNGK
jgi:hypothetical protein